MIKSSYLRNCEAEYLLRKFPRERNNKQITAYFFERKLLFLKLVAKKTFFFSALYLTPIPTWLWHPKHQILKGISNLQYSFHFFLVMFVMFHYRFPFCNFLSFIDHIKLGFYQEIEPSKQYLSLFTIYIKNLAPRFF